MPFSSPSSPVNSSGAAAAISGAAGVLPPRRRGRCRSWGRLQFGFGFWFRPGLGAPPGEVAGARVSEVRAAAWSPAPFLELGPAGAVDDGSGGLLPPGCLVGVGLPVPAR